MSDSDPRQWPGILAEVYQDIRRVAHLATHRERLERLADVHGQLHALTRMCHEGPTRACAADFLEAAFWLLSAWVAEGIGGPPVAAAVEAERQRAVDLGLVAWQGPWPPGRASVAAAHVEAVLRCAEPAPRRREGVDHLLRSALATPRDHAAWLSALLVHLGATGELIAMNIGTQPEDGLAQALRCALATPACCEEQTLLRAAAELTLGFLVPQIPRVALTDADAPETLTLGTASGALCIGVPETERPESHELWVRCECGAIERYALHAATRPGPCSETVPAYSADGEDFRRGLGGLCAHLLSEKRRVFVAGAPPLPPGLLDAEQLLSVMSPAGAEEVDVLKFGLQRRHEVYGLCPIGTDGAERLEVAYFGTDSGRSGGEASLHWLVDGAGHRFAAKVFHRPHSAMVARASPCQQGLKVRQEIRLLDAFGSGVRIHRHLHHAARSYCVLTLMTGSLGDLFDLSRTANGLAAGVRRALVRRAARELAVALARCHDGGVVHRDVKPGNGLWDGSGRVCLTDFSMAAHAEDLSGCPPSLMGTIGYLAPEVASRATSGPAIDMWGLGMTVLDGLVPERREPCFAEDDEPSLILHAAWLRQQRVHQRYETWRRQAVEALRVSASRRLPHDLLSQPPWGPAFSHAMEADPALTALLLGAVLVVDPGARASASHVAHELDQLQPEGCAADEDAVAAMARLEACVEQKRAPAFEALHRTRERFLRGKIQPRKRRGGARP